MLQGDLQGCCRSGENCPMLWHMWTWSCAEMLPIKEVICTHGCLVQGVRHWMTIVMAPGTVVLGESESTWSKPWNPLQLRQWNLDVWDLRMCWNGCKITIQLIIHCHSSCSFKKLVASYLMSQGWEAQSRCGVKLSNKCWMQALQATLTLLLWLQATRQIEGACWNMQSNWMQAAQPKWSSPSLERRVCLIFFMRFFL